MNEMALDLILCGCHACRCNCSVPGVVHTGQGGAGPADRPLAGSWQTLVHTTPRLAGHQKKAKPLWYSRAASTASPSIAARPLVFSARTVNQKKSSSLAPASAGGKVAYT